MLYDLKENKIKSINNNGSSEKFSVHFLLYLCKGANMNCNASKC